MRSRALVIVVLLVSYGAVGARQPAVRVSALLPLPANQLAEGLQIVSVDRSHLMTDMIRTLFSVGMAEGDVRLRGRLRDLLATPSTVKGETVPLPLDVSIWRETILQRQVPDDQIVSAILADRVSALLYHGLAGLDDDTLAWLGPERDVLRQFARHAGVFAAFGPSVRVRAGKVMVPGGPETEPLWQALVGVDPAKPAAFIRRLYDSDQGQLAWFYDAIDHLDEARIRFATGANLPAASRIERARALLDSFMASGREWRPEEQPFSRRPHDPAMTLALVSVDADGNLLGPTQRAMWERVFNEGDDILGSAPARDSSNPSDAPPVDAAWIISRIHRTTIETGRRRLETFLFGQRMFPDARNPDPTIPTILRAQMAFPALMATLERAGVTSTTTLMAAANRAHSLNEIGDDQRRRVATLQYQATLGILDRIARAGAVPKPQLEILITDLSQVESSGRGYEGKLGLWIRKDLIPRLPAPRRETPDEAEDTIVAAMAGLEHDDPKAPTVEWEGRAYRINAVRAERTRLHRLRQRQGGPTLSAGFATPTEKGGPETSDHVLADVLTSVLYAAYLGDPEGPALGGGNIALKHDLGTSGASGPRSQWRLPVENHSPKGWKVSGSLLGLDAALARMSLRRLDSGIMPPEPRMVSAERQTAALSVALLSPSRMTDATRDEIAAAVARGRARVEALGTDRADIERVAHDAGLSAWRRESMAWSAAHQADKVASQFSLVELLWLGKPRLSAAIALDAWGAANLPLTGCLCLAMPRAQPWENLIGRPSLGLMATRGADVAILVADTLSSLKMPAALAPGVVAYAMQEVLDQARPSHFDDWPEFSRATLAITRDQLVDYIAAQAAGGALVPARTTDDRNP